MGRQGLVLSDTKGDSLELTINSQATLNSLNSAIIEEMIRAVSGMKESQLVLRGRGRAFCAGGDVKAVYSLLCEGRLQEGIDFFLRQFVLDRLIARLGKRTVAVWSGIVMGGGVGLSFMCSQIICTPKTLFAMPETRIGFVVDVGVSYLFTRLGKKGTFLGVTGFRLKGRQLYDLGIATHYSQAQNPVEGASQPAKQPVLQEVQGIELGSFSRYCQQLSALKGQLGKQVRQHLSENSKYSMTFVYYYLLEAAELGLTYEKCLERDERAVAFFLRSGMFKQGVRCLLVDKGAVPDWPLSQTEAEIQALVKVMSKM